MEFSQKVSNFIARICYISAGLCAIAVFIFLFGAYLHGLNQAIPLSELVTSIFHGAVFSGLVPMALSAYFWIIRKDERANIVGFAIVLFSIPLHFLFAMFMAHASNSIVNLLTILELGAATAIIYRFSISHKASNELGNT